MNFFCGLFVQTLRSYKQTATPWDGGGSFGKGTTWSIDKLAV